MRVVNKFTTLTKGENPDSPLLKPHRVGNASRGERRLLKFKLYIETLSRNECARDLKPHRGRNASRGKGRLLKFEFYTDCRFEQYNFETLCY